MDSLSRQEKEFLVVLAYVFLEHDRPDRAVTVYDALRHFDPDDVYLLKCLSYALSRSNQHDRALGLAEQGLAMNAAQADTDFLHMIRGRSLWNLGRQQEARHAVAAVLGRRSEQAQGHD